MWSCCLGMWIYIYCILCVGDVVSLIKNSNYSKTTVKLTISVIPNLFSTRDPFCGRQFFHKLEERGGEKEHATYIPHMHSLLCGPVPNRPWRGPVGGLGVGNPIWWIEEYGYEINVSKNDYFWHGECTNKHWNS